jgi:hypothetical protein
MSETYFIADESGSVREYVEAPERCFGYGDYIIVKHPEYKDYIVKYHEEMEAPGGCRINLLIPLGSEGPSVEESPDITDLLANLARRVASLEHKIESVCDQLRDPQRNLETFAEQTVSNTKEIAMLDNRTYSLTTVQSAEGLLNEIERLLKRRSDCR